MLLGRDRERQELERVLASARSGRSAVLALVGEAGIGKTALLDDAAAGAERVRVLRARGVESELHVPFAALFELLRPALRLLDRIPAPQAAALESALALRPNVGGERFAVGAATLSLLAAFSEEEPVLLLVDDAHLLDASSAEAVRFALRRLLAEPVAAVLAVRDGEPSLLDDAGLPTLHVAGLDRTAAGELLVTLPPELAERLYAATAGNPLALLELGADPDVRAALVEDAPLPVSARVSRAFRQRAEPLDAAARDALLLAAAHGSGDVATLERAAAGFGVDFAALAAAEAAGLVRIHEGRVEFRHPLARAAIYGDAEPERRREAHRALAAALPDRDLDRRAWHLAAAAIGTDAAASAALAQAGARARDRSAYAVAAAAFERAARLTPEDERRGRLFFAAADAAWLAGLGDEAVGLLAEAGEHADDDELLVRIDHLRGHIAARRGPTMDGYRILAAAAERAAAHDAELAVTLYAEAIDASFFAAAPQQMELAAARLRDLLPDEPSPRTRVIASTAAGMADVLAGDGPRGIAAIRSAVELAEATAELRSDVRLLSWLTIGPLFLREAEAGRALFDAAIDAARSQAALGILPWLLNRVARDRAATADWARAGVEYDEAIRLARESGQRTELAAALAGVAWLEARQGREAECRAHASEARELCAQVGVGLYDTWALRALGELELGAGNAEQAIEHFEKAERRLEELGTGDVDLSPAAELVDAYLRVGRTDDAEAAATGLERHARSKGQPWSLARAARARGLVREEGFEEEFGDALSLHEQTPDVFETACTHLAYGARLRRTRRRVRAREELREAIERFDRLGAEPWSGRARRELAATGETARRRDPSTIDLLTPQELQIAQLLTGGRTTKEAAAALFLSPKTIEYHLRHVYRKLGVNSRDELARRLDERSPA